MERESGKGEVSADVACPSRADKGGMRGEHGHGIEEVGAASAQGGGGWRKEGGRGRGKRKRKEAEEWSGGVGGAAGVGPQSILPPQRKGSHRANVYSIGGVTIGDYVGEAKEKRTSTKRSRFKF